MKPSGASAVDWLCWPLASSPTISTKRRLPEAMRPPFWLTRSTLRGSVSCISRAVLMTALAPPAGMAKVRVVTSPGV